MNLNGDCFDKGVLVLGGQALWPTPLPILLRFHSVKPAKISAKISVKIPAKTASNGTPQTSP
jgi:hypothetical protein